MWNNLAAVVNMNIKMWVLKIKKKNHVFLLIVKYLLTLFPNKNK